MTAAMASPASQLHGFRGQASVEVASKPDAECPSEFVWDYLGSPGGPNVKQKAHLLPLGNTTETPSARDNVEGRLLAVNHVVPMFSPLRYENGESAS